MSNREAAASMTTALACRPSARCLRSSAIVCSSTYTRHAAQSSISSSTKSLPSGTAALSSARARAFNARPVLANRVGALFARLLPDASHPKNLGNPGSLPGARVSGTHQKGGLSLFTHAISFVLTRPVTQPVIPLNFSEEAALEEQEIERLQGEFPLMGRMEGPAIVPTELMRLAQTYRQACRLAWMLRRLRKLTFRQLAAECELIYQHVGDYFNPDDHPYRRDLPGDAVKRVESFLGNTAISQWHAMNASFTVLEVVQAGQRRAVA